MLMSESLLLLSAAIVAMALANPVPHAHRHGHQSRHSNSSNNTNTSNTNLIKELNLMIPQQYQSIYVLFADRMPESPPPWYQVTSGVINRRRRSSDDTSSHAHIPQSVCDSRKQWVMKETAIDTNGANVTVVQRISVNGMRINQYFYETTCLQENCQCRGIDTDRYSSKCENKYIWAYAKVRDNYGTVAWNLIKLGGSCGCSITELTVDPDQSIWDDLR